MIRSGPAAALDLLRDALVDDTAAQIDGVFLDAVAAVPNVRPAGLVSQAGANAKAASGADAAAARKDLRGAADALLASGAGVLPTWIMGEQMRVALASLVLPSGHPAFPHIEDAQPTIFGWPVMTSLSAPSQTILLVDAADLLTAAEPVPEVDVAKSALIHMADDPKALTDGAAPGGVANPLRSLFQTDSLALRLTWAWTGRCGRAGRCRPSRARPMRDAGEGASGARLVAALRDAVRDLVLPELVAMGQRIDALEKRLAALDAAKAPAPRRQPARRNAA